MSMRAAEIRQSFIDYFIEQNHTVVPSASIVPGGDATLLFTNAGMVQFKDVFLGTDKRGYQRAVDSQKCMRVAGKHNDLEDVGTDDTHHTFFEMLGNWSFGDYYKKEAIEWAWQLLTQVWKLPEERLYATCFKDEKGEIPADEEAANFWKMQPGMNNEHVLFFGRKDNFWEMAETGPCGPCSEIHLDRGEAFCDKREVKGHICGVNGECKRFLELWNLVFIQYNRMGPKELKPLPATHVDTGMGFERIVSVLQGVDSNYKTDLFVPALEKLRGLSGASEEEMYANFTPYRVIADHCRAAVFLIADGVVPGNTGRNYICRMIIRRAARFGTKIGLHEPFLAKIARAFVAAYGDFFPEVMKNEPNILEHLTREETRFARTVESGSAFLEGILENLKDSGKTTLSGEKAFELYGTYGLPFEIARDIAREMGLTVDEVGFRAAMDEHRLASGGGKAMGEQGGGDADLYRRLSEKWISEGKLGKDGVVYNPYQLMRTNAVLVGLIQNGEPTEGAVTGDRVEVVINQTGFYLEAGGQVMDTGRMQGEAGAWEIEVNEVKKPAPGVVVHAGEVVFGQPKVGDVVLAEVDLPRRKSIMRNHTATHLLHAELHKVLGVYAQQAGSLVAPDRLRFDFNHPTALSAEQLEQIELGVNQAILADHRVTTEVKGREKAIQEGAMALFGEKYGEVVRTVAIGTEMQDKPSANRVSFELCGGTHLENTGVIGTFLILSEGSVAAGVRRIEAVTGDQAYKVIAERMKASRNLSRMLSAAPDEIEGKVESVLRGLEESEKKIGMMKAESNKERFLAEIEVVNKEDSSIKILVFEAMDAEPGLLRNLSDIFRRKVDSGILTMGTVTAGRPMIIASSTDDLVELGFRANDFVVTLADSLGGSGGGKANLAQAGGKDPEKLKKTLVEASELLEVEKKRLEIKRTSKK